MKTKRLSTLGRKLFTLFLLWDVLLPERPKRFQRKTKVFSKKTHVATQIKPFLEKVCSGSSSSSSSRQSKTNNEQQTTMCVARLVRGEADGKYLWRGRFARGGAGGLWRGRMWRGRMWRCRMRRCRWAWRSRLELCVAEAVSERVTQQHDKNYGKQTFLHTETKVSKG